MGEDQDDEHARAERELEERRAAAREKAAHQVREAAQALGEARRKRGGAEGARLAAEQRATERWWEGEGKQAGTDRDTMVDEKRKKDTDAATVAAAASGRSGAGAKTMAKTRGDEGIEEGR